MPKVSHARHPGGGDDIFGPAHSMILAALFAIAECTERRRQAFGRTYDYLMAKLRMPLHLVKAR